MKDGKIDFRLCVTSSNWVAYFERTPNLPVLTVEAVTKMRRDIWRNQCHTLYNVPLATLTLDEANLQKGRFAHFHYEPMNIPVILLHHHHSRPLDVGSILDWIGKNVHHGWSLSVEFYDIIEAEFIWTFEDVTEALLFKLSWS